MFNRKMLVAVPLTIACAAALVLTTTGSARQPTYKLQGAWVSRVPGYPMQWTTMFAPTDLLGRHATLWGTLEVPIPPQALCTNVPTFDATSDYMGEAVMIGPDKAQVTMIGYSLYQGQIAFIWMAAGELKFTGPCKGESTFRIAYYLPSADTNGDGIPETAPFCVIGPSATIDTRLGVMDLPGVEN